MSVTTGLSEGEFTGLRVLKNGTFEDVIDLINAAANSGGGGGGGGNVVSATLPLSLSSSGVLSIDLGAYVTGSNLTTQLSNYALGSALTSGLAGKVSNSRVLTDVPNGALFTDTVYQKPSSEAISYISGLQGALDGKVDDSQVQTNVPANAQFTDTVYQKPSAEPISYITNLQSTLDNKLGGLTVSGILGVSGSGSSRALTADVSALATTASVNTLLQNYTETTAMNTALAAKQGVVSNVSDVEIGYLDGVTSGIQTQLNAKQATMGAGSNIAINNNTISVTGLNNYATTADLNGKQDVVANVSDTEIGYLNNVSSNIQTQLNSKIEQISAVLPLTATSSANTVTIESLWKPSNFSVSPGLTKITSDTLGLVSISMDNNFEFSDLKVKDSLTNVKSLTHASGDLKWDGAALATQTFANNLLSSNVTVGGDLSVEGGDITMATAATTNNFGLPILSFHGGAVNYFSAGFTVTSTGSNNDTQALRITRTGTITSTSAITTHSDRSIKTEIEDLDASAAMELLLRVNAKNYKRTDFEQDKVRLGFIAQDFENVEFAPNLVGEEPAEGLKTLDYARLTAVLWSCCQSMHARLAALEAKGTRKKAAT